MKSLQESLFDPRLVSKYSKDVSLLDVMSGDVRSFDVNLNGARGGLPLHKWFSVEKLQELKKDYGEVVIPTKRYRGRYEKKWAIVNFFINYILANIRIPQLSVVGKELDAEIELDCTVLNKKMKTDVDRGDVTVEGGKFWGWQGNTEMITVNIFLRYTSSSGNVWHPIIYLETEHSIIKKVLQESLFDKNLATEDITTLYALFGGHIKKFQHTYGGGLGWTHFFNQTFVVRQWKKDGRPELSGGFAKTTFPSDLQKFIAVILNNTVVTKEQIIKMPEDGNFDDRPLNDRLEEQGILMNTDEYWGATKARHMVRVQIGYIEGTPPNSDHGVQFRQVGTKRFKGLNTEKIELSIYCYDPKSAGFGCHIWTLLTDLSIKDLKK